MKLDPWGPTITESESGLSRFLDKTLRTPGLGELKAPGRDPVDLWWLGHAAKTDELYYQRRYRD